MVDETNKANGDNVHDNGQEDKNVENCNSETPKLHERILKQVEYYFGNINLPKDKFMLEQMKSNDGWIPMSIMLKFQRLAKLSSDPKVIAQALEPSDLVEVDSSGEEIRIRRSLSHPLTEITDESFKELQSRSVYCKGFPLDYTMDNLIDYFSKFGPFENIIQRKYKDKLSKSFKFKGSVFVTYESKEKAKAFLDLENVKCSDIDLIRKWQLDYIEEKKKEILNNKLKRSKKHNEDVEKEVKENFPRGATLHLQGDFSELSREDIRDKFNNLGYESAFVAFNKGEKEAHIRLNRENAGKDFIEKEGKEVEIAKSKLEARLLEGEEEDKFLKKALEDKHAYFKKCQKSKQGGRKAKGRGKKGNPKKRKESFDATEIPPAKKVPKAE